ncbi:MAG TPA: hypothetical protein VGN12_19345 [Pirellulales bacterium]|jgi:hypothetical protein
MVVRHITLAALAAAACFLSPVQAAIVGFGDFSGFSINQTDAGSPPTVSIATGTIHLTNGGSSESRSIFTSTKQAVGSFTASFTYQATNIGFNFDAYQGITFVVENSASGSSAVGSSGGLGYLGVPSSLGIIVGLLNQGTAVTVSELAKNGSIPSGPGAVSPVNAYSGDPINVVISYNGSLVHEGLTDTVTNGNWSTDYVLSPSLVTMLGSSTAYVGVTGGTVAGADQYISNFQFTSAVPEPCMAGAMMIGSLLAIRRRR